MIMKKLTVIVLLTVAGLTLSGSTFGDHWCDQDFSGAPPPPPPPPRCQDVCEQPLPCDPPDSDPCGPSPPCVPECEQIPDCCPTSPFFAKTGAYTTQATDLFVQSPTFPIDLTRRYTSVSSFTGYFGPGWEFSYDARLIPYVEGAAGSTTRGVIVKQANGKRWRFIEAGESGGLRSYDGPGNIRVFLTEDFSTGTSEYILDDYDRQETRVFDSEGRLVSISDRVGQTIQLEYNSPGGCLSKVENVRSGEYVEFSVANGRIDAMTDHAGRTVSYQYYAAGEDVTWPQPWNNPPETVPEGFLKQVTDAAGRKTIYQYRFRTGDDDYLLTGVKLRVEDPVDLDVFEEYVERVGYQEVNIASAINTNRLLQRQYKVDFYVEKGRLFYLEYVPFQRTDKFWATSNVDLSVDPPTFDRLEADPDPRWGFIYNAQGLVTTREYPDPDGPGGPESPSSEQFEYDAATGRLTQETDRLGVTTAFTYNANNQRETITRDAGGLDLMWTYEYDTNFPDQLKRVIPPQDAGGNLMWPGKEYEYYADDGVVGDGALAGQIHKVFRIQSDGITTDLLQEFTYVDDPSSAAFGRVETITDAAGAVTENVYDPATGDLYQVKLPKNNDTADPEDRPVFTYGYNLQNQLTSVIDPLNHETMFAYDDVERLISTTPPDPDPGDPNAATGFTTDVAYDSVDDVANLLFETETDPNNNSTQRFLDQFGRLREAVDANLNATTYTYHEGGLLDTVTDANGNEMSFTYDYLDRLIEKNDFNGGVWNYSYYDDGLLKTQEDPENQVIFFEYDPFGRIIEKCYTSDCLGKHIEYFYTNGGAGQGLEQVVEHDGAGGMRTTTLAYDDSFRVQSETTPEETVGFAYYIAGSNETDRVATETAGGFTKTYAYYDDGSLKNIEDSATASGNISTITYRLTGEEAAIQYADYPMGIDSVVRSYDNQGRLTDIVNRDTAGAVIASYGYGYDFDHQAVPQPVWKGLRTSETENGTDPREFHYDDLYQLTKTKYPDIDGAGLLVDIDDRRWEWAYDAIGNRTNQVVKDDADNTIATTSYDYDASASQLLVSETGASSTFTYTWDANGNLLSRTNTTTGEIFSYAWDEDNRLTKVEKQVVPNPVETIGQYLYDFRGNRVRKVEKIGEVDVTTTYVYSSLNIVKEVVDDGVTVKTFNYVYGPGIDEPFYSFDGTDRNYYYPDGLGSIKKVANDVPQENTYIYDAWGQVAKAVELIGNSFGYTAREFSNTDLWYYRARYYQPGVGRFNAIDPLMRDFALLQVAATESIIHPYNYAVNVPTMFVDPLGLRHEPMCTEGTCGECTHDRCKDKCKSCDGAYCACRSTCLFNYIGLKPLCKLICGWNYSRCISVVEGDKGCGTTRCIDNPPSIAKGDCVEDRY
jgi:RHS repeat-associated protein